MARGIRIGHARAVRIAADRYDFSINGQSAGTLRKSLVSAAAGSYGVSGQAAALVPDWTSGPPPVAQVTTFQLTSTTTDAAAPFQIGLPFKKGDVPSSITTNLPGGDYQIIVKRRWNDNSIKHAIISGKAALTANVPLTVTVSTGTAPTGTSMTAADIQAAAPTASVNLGIYGTVNLSSLLATPFRTWISGPRMVECHYRADVAGTEMMVWFHVRMWAGGRMRIQAIVENGTFDNAAKTAAGARTPRPYNVAYTVGGTQVWSRQAANITSLTNVNDGGSYRLQIVAPGHTLTSTADRIYLSGLTGMPEANGAYFNVYSVVGDTITTAYIGTTPYSAWTSGGTASWVHESLQRYIVEGWIGGEVTIYPTHDSGYMQATKLVPSYGHKPIEAAYDGSTGSQPAMQLTYTQTIKGNIEPLMNGTGYMPSVGILPHWEACYVADPYDGGQFRGWRATLANTSAYNFFPVLARSYQTKELIKPSDYLRWSYGGNSVSNPGNQIGQINWSADHQPMVGYLAYLCSGDFWHYETLLGICATNYGAAGYDRGYGLDRFMMSGSSRGSGWAARTYGALCAIAPEGDAIAAEYRQQFLNTCNTYISRFASETRASALGLLSPGNPNTGQLGISPSQLWMMHYITTAFGFISDMDCASDAEMAASIIPIRTHLYRNITGRVGATGDATKWHYSLMGMYRETWFYAYGNVFDTYDETRWAANWGEAWQMSFKSPNTASMNKLRTRDEVPDTVDALATGVDGVLSQAHYPAQAASSYWGPAWMALCYAAEHDAPGAIEGFIRITNASNYAELYGASWGTQMQFALVTPKFSSALSWRRGQAIGEWRRIPGSKMDNTPPTVLLTGPGQAGGYQNRIRAFCGLGYDRRTNTFWALGNGGHQDYWGNEVLKVTLNAETNPWVEMWPSDTYAQSQPDLLPNGTGYYQSGRPSSAHTYFTQHVIERNNRVMRMGVGSCSSGGYAAANVDAVPTTAIAGAGPQWDAQGTYANLIAANTEIFFVKHPVTEDVYNMRQNYAVDKWSAATPYASWASVNVAYPPFAPAGAIAVDTKRERIFTAHLPSNRVCTFDLSSGTFSLQTLSGDTSVLGATQATPREAMAYVPALDAYIWTSGQDLNGGQIYKIDASTFVVTAFATSGGTGMMSASRTRGDGERTYNRFQLSPTLQGILYVPDSNEDIWLLRTH